MSSRPHMTNGQITAKVIAVLALILVIAATVVLPAWH